jgi:hypothetical protein
MDDFLNTTGFYYTYKEGVYTISLPIYTVQNYIKYRKGSSKPNEIRILILNTAMVHGIPLSYLRLSEVISLYLVKKRLLMMV